MFGSVPVVYTRLQASCCLMLNLTPSSPVTQGPWQMGWTRLSLNLAPSTHTYHILSLLHLKAGAFERLESKDTGSSGFPAQALLLSFCNTSQRPLPAGSCAPKLGSPFPVSPSPLPRPPEATPCFLFCPSPQFLFPCFWPALFLDQTQAGWEVMRTRWTERRNCPNGYENVGAVRHGEKLEFFSNKMGFIATLPQSLPTTVYLDRNPIPIGHADADSFFPKSDDWYLF